MHMSGALIASRRLKVAAEQAVAQVPRALPVEVASPLPVASAPATSLVQDVVALPKGWTRIESARGPPVYWNGKFEQQADFLEHDPTDTVECIQDLFAWPKLWEGSDRLFSWCDACRQMELV